MKLSNKIDLFLPILIGINAGIMLCVAFPCAVILFSVIATSITLVCFILWVVVSIGEAAVNEEE